MAANPVRIEELLAHAPWVRALAARLVRDAAGADDVAQEVWASALRSPPRERANLRGWLARAVRSAARSRGRGEQRRVERERRAEPAREVEDPAELVERAQLHRELVEHVLALDDPGRSLVLAHWFEGHSVAESGRRLGLTARVAQLRLDAAHQELARRLDERWGGRGAWCAVFAPWTRPEPAAAALGGAVVLGGVTLATKWIVSAAAVLVAVLVLASWPDDRDPGPASPPLVSLAAPASLPAHAESEAGRSRADEPAESRSAPAPVPAAAPAAPPATPWIVRGRVRGPGGLDLGAARVRALFLGTVNIVGAAEGQPGSDGSYELDLTAVVERWQHHSPTELLVTVDHPQCLPAEARVPVDSVRSVSGASGGAQRVYACDVVLPMAAVVTGRVLFPRGFEDPKGVQVGLYDAPGGVIDGRGGVDYALVDADGRWSLRANHAGEFAVIAAARRMHVESRRVELTLGTSVDAGDIALEHGASIEGTVVGADGPVAGAPVVAQVESTSQARVFWTASRGFDGAPPMLLEEGGRLTPSESSTQAGADGRFRLEGLQARDYALMVTGTGRRVRMGFGGERTVEKTVRAPASGVVLESVPPWIRLTVSVDGRAPEPGTFEENDFQVRLAPLPYPERAMHLRLEGCTGEFGEIGVEAGVEYEFQVESGRFRTMRLHVPPLARGEQRSVHLDLSQADSRTLVLLRVVGDPGESAESVQRVRIARLLEGSAGRSSPEWLTVEADAGGVCALRFLPPGRSRLRLASGGFGDTAGRPWLGTELELDVPAEGTLERTVMLELGARLRISAVDERGGFVQTPVELRDARGTQIATEFFCRTPDMSYGCGWYLCGQGINDHPPLRAGRYEIDLKAEGFEPRTVPFELKQGETTTLEVVLRPR